MSLDPNWNYDTTTYKSDYIETQCFDSVDEPQTRVAVRLFSLNSVNFMFVTDLY